ncbi:viperin family antiviral radical SAM protein [Brachyspira hampsonii]|uniref:S-adenosylmethionine-dependent nucleotide dehydratase n=1 Tax=Brachyspira hampsonii 30446 TaxID=1289135 RepID=A0A2U4EUY3_9SPIR|nr:viperin family antiviral radical SAM protein [Brachyspira hampsonii]EKV56538.1 radical SAM protein [Brachyspira hampsonii 30446]MBW5389458.1 radical SAM protein [Brachyspira hampsonii]MBW5393974.1 radical SAM protein [Brachyspira hampsonii]OEJ20135.1 radical SAM protein [Brachyspira hampsonii]
MSIFNSLKLNWHFINNCNMHCKFCYASKDICNIDLFKIASILKPFKYINLVGGEPTIYKNYIPLLYYLKSQNHILSIVSNGSMLLKDKSILNATLECCDVIGLSIDSLDKETCLKIGRSIGNSSTITEKEYLYLTSKIKESGKELKINTVVNRYNYKENLNSFIEKTLPNKWKIFQVLPIENLNSCKELLISDEEFNYFLNTHAANERIIYSENNNNMTSSYIMLDAKARFFNNIDNKYIYSKSLLEDDADLYEEFFKMNYSIDKYYNRYKKAN